MKKVTRIVPRKSRDRRAAHAALAECFKAIEAEDARVEGVAIAIQFREKSGFVNSLSYEATNHPVHLLGVLRLLMAKVQRGVQSQFIENVLEEDDPDAG